MIHRAMINVLWATLFAQNMINVWWDQPTLMQVVRLKKKKPKYNSIDINDEVNSNSLRDDSNGHSHIFLITWHI